MLLHAITSRIARTRQTGDYFFIVGCPRSGTTLLSVLLDRHTRLSVPPETAFFDEVAPRLTPNNQDTLLDVLHRWQRLRELKLEAEAVVRRLGRRKWKPSDVLAAILDLYALAHAKQRCGEKTPQHLVHVSTILTQFPHAKIICMLRDGRDVALSLASMPWWSEGSLESAADMWLQSVRLTRTFALQYPAQFRVVRYENLVTHPQQELASIMEYLAETFEPSQLQADLPSEVVLPRSMRWKRDALDPVNTIHIGQRRNTATARELAFLEQVLGEELRFHGYD